MPYIRQEDRDILDGYIDWDNMMIESPGELNYLFTRLCLKYLDRGPVDYAAYNDCIGALTACQLELYRRMTAPYEDKKIVKNGDVY